MFKSTAQKMQDNLFNLKLAAKQLERNAVKCEKDEKAEKGKLKKAIQKSNLEGARIHAENAIRQKNQGLNYRRMSSRVDAVSQRVQTACTMQQVTKSMGGVVSAMESAMKSMNLEKVTKLMDDFERQFEHLDVQTQVMDEAMQGTTVLNMPEAQVDNLMQEVADEAGLELNMELSAQQVGLPSTATQEQDGLSARLAQLREQQNN